MAQPREPAFQHSSPDSSKGGADSYNNEGTPDTRLTAFSPQESSAKSSKLAKASLAPPDQQQPGRFAVQAGNAFRAASGLQLEKDPFITPAAAAKPEQKLSATASAFRPFSALLLARSTDDGAAALAHTEAEDPQQAICPSPRVSTNLNLSRCVVVSSSSHPVSAADADHYLLKLEQLGSPCQGGRQIHVKDGQAYLRFTNIRDACMVHRNIQLAGPGWAAAFLSPPEFVQTATPGCRLATSFEGQLNLLALVRQGLRIDIAYVETTVRQLLQAEGDLFAFQREVGLDNGILRAVVEYSDTTTALTAFWKYHHGLTVHGIQIVLSLHRTDGFAGWDDPHEGITTPMATPLRQPLQDLPSAFRSLSMGTKTPQPPSAMVGASPHTPSNVGLPVHSQFAVYPMMYRAHFTPGTPYVTPRSHTMTPITTNFPLVSPVFSHHSPASPALPMPADLGVPRSLSSPYIRPDGRRQNAMRVARTPYYHAAGHHNHVDVVRIREGTDVRTTIMLRNIPNKVDQVMLKTIVDESSWGKYDFMYLRIDFANDCNVGYAFINFVDPLDIIDFVNARGNQRWNCFKSDKVAEISYATIQGKDCLVQKFRNSSVMLEAPHYRPKLYYTSNGPTPELAGQEEPFPEPDNQSKMKRSCENAEHVGLFTPNAGQHFRDEQRRRRSQYDRGTRLAALEEYDYEISIQQHVYTPS